MNLGVVKAEVSSGLKPQVIGLRLVMRRSEEVRLQVTALRAVKRAEVSFVVKPLDECLERCTVVKEAEIMG